MTIRTSRVKAPVAPLLTFLTLVPLSLRPLTLMRQWGRQWRGVGCMSGLTGVQRHLYEAWFECERGKGELLQRVKAHFHQLYRM